MTIYNGVEHTCEAKYISGIELSSDCIHPSIDTGLPSGSTASGGASQVINLIASIADLLIAIVLSPVYFSVRF